MRIQIDRDIDIYLYINIYIYINIYKNENRYEDEHAAWTHPKKQTVSFFALVDVCTMHTRTCSIMIAFVD